MNLLSHSNISSARTETLEYKLYSAVVVVKISACIVMWEYELNSAIVVEGNAAT